MSLKSAATKLKSYYAKRLAAGLPLTLDEWGRLSALNKALWESVLTEHTMKMQALQAYMTADAIAGGTIAVEVVWELLPEKVQDAWLVKWGKANVNKPRK